MRRLILAALAAAALPLAARAEVLNFDDLPTVAVNDLVPSPYHGFDTNNLYYTTQGDFPGQGFDNAETSTPNAAFNGGGGGASLTNALAFTLNDGWFTQGFFAGNVTVTGRTSIGGAADFTKTFAVGLTPTKATFNWTGLHEVDFSAANSAGQQLHFAFDDLRVNDPVSAGGVPEPVEWALMLVGFGGVGALLRRRRAAALA